MSSSIRMPCVLALILLVPGGALCAGDEPSAPSIRILTSHPQPMMANLGDAYRAVRLGPDSDATAEIVAALAEHHDGIEFREVPLRDALLLVADKTGVRVRFDHRAFEDAGIDLDTTVVTGSLAGTSVGAGLREILADLDLATMYRNGRLVVTTADAAREHPARYFYPALGGTDLDELSVLIETTIAPSTWNSNGGLGVIMPVPDQIGTGLVISQTEEVHEEIATLLSGLDAALWQADDVDDGVEPRFVRTYLVSDPQARDAVVEHLVTVCNRALPHGADPDAEVTVFGESIVVQSKSRPFQVMAAQVLAALEGVETFLMEDTEDEDGEGAKTTEATTLFRKTAGR